MKKHLWAVTTILVSLLLLSFLSAGTATAAGTIDFSGMGWCNPINPMYPTGVGQFDNQDYLRKYGVRHAGYDIVDKSGKSQVVYALDDGTVTRVYRNSDAKNVSVIYIRHKTSAGTEFIAVYGHTYAVSTLKEGASVKKGDKIGNTKKYNVYHLHLGINIKGSFSKWGTTASNVDPTNAGWRDPTVWLLKNAASGYTTNPPENNGSGENAKIKVRKITLNTKSATMLIDSTSTLAATVTPSNASNKSIQWTSSKPSIASVSSSGVVTAKGKGTATITATAMDGSKKKASCKITVIVPVRSIQVPDVVFVKKNAKYKLSMTIAPSNASNKAVKWSSENTRIAGISSSGIVTAKSVGRTVITVKARDGSNVQGSTVAYVYASGYPINGTVYNATALRVRTGATPEAKVIGHLSNGSIKVYGPEINGFYPVRGTDQDTNKTIFGFASKDYIKID